MKGGFRNGLILAMVIACGLSQPVRANEVEESFDLPVLLFPAPAAPPSGTEDCCRTGWMWSEPGEFDHLMVAAGTLGVDAVSSALEAGLYVGLYGGTLATAGAVFSVSMMTAAAVYLVHDHMWNAAESNMDTSAEAVSRINAGRIAAKVFSYRILLRAVTHVRTDVLPGLGQSVTTGLRLLGGAPG